MSGYSNGDAIRRLLKALSDGRDLITEAYNAGGALPAGFDPDDQKLLSLRLFRVFTGTPDGYLLSPGLGEVIATALREDRSGYIDTAFEKRLQDAEEYAARAARHRKEGRYADADIALKSLKDAVRSIDYGVRHTVERLDLRITNRFGFVTSLDDKIAENQHAIDDTSRLIESLGKFTLAHFDEVSGGDREVYRILRALSDSIDESRRLLSAVLTRLSMLLMVFRREERETGVLRSFSEWFRKITALRCGIWAMMRRSRASSGSRRLCAPAGTRTSGTPLRARHSPRLSTGSLRRNRPLPRRRRSRRLLR